MQNKATLKSTKEVSICIKRLKGALLREFLL